mmetsp:Transcript_7395/g.10281  ORF Transcript_7395/g.10281 Transcript_7395/m.10281 type:complete len:454 (-) Transcript_7395:240-1601(-)
MSNSIDRRKLYLAYFALVLVQLLYCIWHVLGKKALNDGLNPFVLAMYRQDGALVVMIFLARFVDKVSSWRTFASIFGIVQKSVGGVASLYTQEEIMTENKIIISPQDRWALVVLGILGFGNIYGFILALSYVTSFNSALLHPIIPVTSALIASISGVETATKRTMIGVSFGAFGALIVVLFGVERDKSNTEGDPHGFSSRRIAIGNIYLLGQCLCMGALLVLQKALHTRTKIPATTLTALYNSIAAFLATLTTLIIIRQHKNSYSLQTANEIAAVVYGAIIGICFVYVLLGWATIVAGPTVVALSMTLQPPLNAVLAVLFLHRTSFSFGEIFGGFIIIAGLCIVVLQKNTSSSVTSPHRNSDHQEDHIRPSPPTSDCEPSPNEYNDLLHNNCTSSARIITKHSNYAPLAVDLENNHNQRLRICDEDQLQHNHHFDFGGGDEDHCTSSTKEQSQ